MDPHTSTPSQVLLHENIGSCSWGYYTLGLCKHLFLHNLGHTTGAETDIFWSYKTAVLSPTHNEWWVIPQNKGSDNLTHMPLNLEGEPVSWVFILLFFSCSFCFLASPNLPSTHMCACTHPYNHLFFRSPCELLPPYSPLDLMVEASLLFSPYLCLRGLRRPPGVLAEVPFGVVLRHPVKEWCQCPGQCTLLPALAMPLTFLHRKCDSPP